MASFDVPFNSAYQQSQTITDDSVNGSCPVAMKQKERKDNLSSVLDSMTGGKVCEATVDSHANNSSFMSSAYFNQQANANAGIFSAGESVSAGLDITNTNQKLDNDETTSGCGDVTLNAITQLLAKEAITCSLTNNESTQAFTLMSKYEIEIVQVGWDAFEYAQQNRIIDGIEKPQLKDSLTMLASVGAGAGVLSYLPEKDRLKFLEIAIKASTSSYQSYLNLVGQITNVGIEVESIVMDINQNTIFETQVQQYDTVDESIKTQYKSALLAAAENEFQQTTGFGTLASDSARSVIENYLSQNEEEIDEMIKYNLKKYSVDASTDGKIKILVKGSLKVKSIVFNAHVQQNLQAQAILESAQTWGKTLASELVSELSTTSTSKFDAKGMDTVAKAFGEANAAQIRAVEEGQANKIKAGAAGGGSLLMFGLIFLMMGGGGGGGGGGKGGGIKKILIFIIIAIIIYLVAAYFLEFWPFKKSEKSIVASDIPSEGGLLMDVKRRHVLPGYNPEMSYSKLNKKELSTAHAKAKIIGKNYIF